jgi:hypothetical protein
MSDGARMTVARGFAIIVASGITFAIAGGLIGSTLARSMPGYYRAVFPGGERPDFDPVQVGVGLGITQGLMAGLVVGSVVVLAVALGGGRRTAATDPTGQMHQPRVPGTPLGGEMDSV